MSIRLGLMIALLCASGSSAGQEPSSNEVTFHAGVELVRMAATVRDGSGRLVTNLTASDFIVLVDGTRTPIVVFARERYPLTVDLVFGTSRSESLERTRAAGHALVDALEPTEQATIASYSDEVAQSPVLTRDKRVLHQILEEELWFGFGNAVLRALGVAIRTLMPHEGKRAVVIVSDDRPDACHVSEACPGEGDVTTAATVTGVVIYGVTVPSDAPPPGLPSNRPDPMRRVSRETGGGIRRLDPHEDVNVAMADVLEELRHEYLIGFTPPFPDGREHEVKVRVQKDGLTPRILQPRKIGAP